jgi:hypothetical protein
MSANKQRDWLDYAGLASQLYQNIQVNDVRNKMAAVGQLALMKEAREQDARIAETNVQRAKEVLFNFSSVLAKLKKRGDDDLRASYLFALKMKRVVQQSGLTTARFPDFADKERMNGFNEELDGYIAQTRAQLSDDDRQAVDRCECYRLELPQLDQLIQFQARREATGRQIELDRQRFAQLKDVTPRQGGKWVAATFGGIGAVLIALGMMEGMAEGADADSVSILIWLGLGGIVIAFAGLLDQNTPETKEQNALYAERQQLEKRFAVNDAAPRPEHVDYSASRLVAFHPHLFPVDGYYVSGTSNHGAIRELFIRVAENGHADANFVREASWDQLINAGLEKNLSIVLCNARGSHVVYTRSAIPLASPEAASQLGQYLDLLPDNLVAVSSMARPEASSYRLMKASQIISVPGRSAPEATIPDSSGQQGAVMETDSGSRIEPGEDIRIRSALSEFGAEAGHATLAAIRQRRIDYICEITGDRPEDLELACGGKWEILPPAGVESRL